MVDNTPSAFSISHYVLLFIVSTLCTISVVWVLIAANNREAAIHDNILKYENGSKTCQRETADKINDMWKSNYDTIPQRYKVMENNYANRVVSIRTTGSCNGKKFICPMGQLRSQCDPCAKSSARKRAVFQHISDSIDQNCKKE